MAKSIGYYAALGFAWQAVPVPSDLSSLDASHFNTKANAVYIRNSELQAWATSQK